VPLLTLTGPGGTGKTRLSLQVAAELIDQFSDGVFFVALAPISDPDLVPATIAQTLEIRDMGGRSALDGLKEYLRDRQMLLVLDNFEQILAAAAVVGELLGASRRLKVLVTSRAPLELRGEHELPVPPLALPDPRRLPTLDILSQYASVALFIERASAISPDFSVTNENAPAVAEICVRLDGLPLAIELAAARIRLLSPQAMLTRLERRLPLLTGGARNLPARQRTLRGAIAWSYDLLDDEEQMLFRRLATFVGGCTLEAAEAVCTGTGELPIDTLDGVASLLAKSLLQQREGRGSEPRFGMLETIREYGLERLEESRELAEARRRHAYYFLAMATEAGSKLKGHEQAYWLARLEADRDNLRAVLSWSQAGDGDEEVGLGLAGALLWFWNMRGSLDEARRWQDAVLARPATAPSLVRARVLFSSGMVALSQSDLDRADGLLQESLDVARALGDPEGVPTALGGLSQLALARGDVARASAYAVEALALARAIGDHTMMALGLGSIGLIALSRGDVAHAETAFQESLALSRQIGDTHGTAWSLNYLGLLAIDAGDHDRGTLLIVESLGLRRQLDDNRGIAGCFEGLAHIAGGTGDPERAGRLLAAASALRDSLHAPLSGAELRRKDQTLSAVRRTLDVDAFERIWASGAALSLQDAIAYALEEPASTPPVGGTSRAH
jgi:predicted ATPase